MSTVKGPDSEQLKQIVDEHQTALLQLCYLYLKDAHLAEDAVQETFLKAVHHWNSFRAESSVKTWLTRIAINTCCNMRRTFWFRRVDRYVTPEDLPEAAQEPESSGENSEMTVKNAQSVRTATIPGMEKALCVVDENGTTLDMYARLSEPLTYTNFNMGDVELNPMLWMNVMNDMYYTVYGRVEESLLLEMFGGE